MDKCEWCDCEQPCQDESMASLVGVLLAMIAFGVVLVLLIGWLA